MGQLGVDQLIMTDVPIGPLVRVPQLVVKLEIIDGRGAAVPSPFPLRDGVNEFWCTATYVDGSRSPFNAYWTCPLILRRGGIDLWSVLGKQRRPSVTLYASKRHERYTELAAWVFEPSNDRHNDFPHAGIGFDYRNIVAD